MKDLIETIQRESSRYPTKIVLLDYDGTLTPIVIRPEYAQLDSQTRQSIRQLCSLQDVHVAIVTGRALRDIEALVNIDTLIYIANHGHILKLQENTVCFCPDFNTSSGFQDKYNAVLQDIQAFAGIQVEVKEVTVSLHYRNVKENDHQACRNAIMESIHSHFSYDEIAIKEGKKMIEILPPDRIDKGTSIEYLLRIMKEQLSQEDFFVLFIGDDLTDEDGFRFLNSIDKLTVKVGPGDTQAKFRIGEISEVTWLLAELPRLL